MQGMKPAEDERKLQTNIFVEQIEWEPKGWHHRMMMEGQKEKSSLD